MSAPEAERTPQTSAAAEQAPPAGATAERAPSGLVLRPAHPDEYDLIGELTVTAYVGGGFVDAGSDYVPTLRDSATRSKEAELLVAELDGTIVGTVTYSPGGGAYSNIGDAEDAEFRMLAVATSARGRGVGAALVRLCVDKARAAGCTALRLSTQTDMVAAQRLYRRLGFVRTPERDWRLSSGFTLITYALPL
ncbi:MAG TPA: GNAT family N-acetyltransferase [Streptosporangiaceae bacterium]|jgi:ribosomal protein S18 acetylase RimI-like enzyme